MFLGCTSLTKAPSLPATTLSDECYKSMFQGCTSLTTAPKLPATTLTRACYSNMFQACESLTQTPVLSAASLAAYCYQYMFQGCSNLNKITMLATNISADSCLSSWVHGVAVSGTFVRDSSLLLSTGISGIPAGWEVEPPMPPICTLTLDNGEVIEIKGSGALTSAMMGQHRLTAINAEIRESCTSISDYAFQGCDKLTSINISSSVASIGMGAFNSCTSLTSITIPDSVTSIGNGAFVSCGGLTSITVDADNPVYDSRNNCNAIIKTSTNELLCGCKNTVIQNTITSIGNGAFNGCKGLSSITIPDSVTSIGSDAFNGCSGLTSITIPSSVTNIGRSAFQYSSNLLSITSLATIAPTITNTTFQNVKTGGTLYIPQGSSGYDVWMGTGNYYLGKRGWTQETIS